jgi:hypothetical protein
MDLVLSITRNRWNLSSPAVTGRGMEGIGPG